ncbi:hypothetical protein Tco_0644752 [Tanacetum coccineum]
MEPKPTRIRETTPVLHARSPRVRRQKERVVEFEDAPNRDGSRVERSSKGRRPSEQRAEDSRNQGTNLPPFLVAYLGRNRNGDRVDSIPGAYSLTTNPISQPDGIDLCDSDCDDIFTAKAVMTNLSSYGSDVLSEVPHSETYQNDMDNQSVQAMQNFEQTLVVDFPDNEITSDSNIIPYSQYL